MSSQRLESIVARVLHRTPGPAVDPGRVTRFVMFCAVGGTGAIIDIALTLGLISQTVTHYLVANTAGFVLAVSWNFVGNWFWTYDRPQGRLGWQYLSYVGLHAATFGLRALVIAILVESAGVPAMLASVIGLGVAALANFGGTEAIFGGSGTVWFDAVEAANHAAHVVWGSRLRRWLQATGVYDPAYSAYAWVLALCYRDETREVRIGDASAVLAMEHPTEIVSNLHTLEKEADVLKQFVDDVRSEDHVLDAGANLGVYATLAGDVSRRVTAVEPHPATANRLALNLSRNDVDGRSVAAALGDEETTVRLTCDRDDLGTQRPRVTADGGEMQVAGRRGDALLGDDPPDVVKIDVEGGEPAVLAGLDGVMDNVRICYVEAHSKHEAHQLEACLAESGFEAERLTDGQEIHIRGEKEVDR